MHPLNILRIFAFSLVLRHSYSSNTLFQIFFLGFFGNPVIMYVEVCRAKITCFRACLHGGRVTLAEGLP